jgi:hypothetical protein
VDQHVLFLGKQNHVERLIPLAHVLLMPSEMESFGLAALEAMACGVVPVATRVGGVPELITDGEDGYLEAVGDIEAQAARVVALLTDDALHWRMAKAGRWNAGERFCTDRIIPQYERYYRDVGRGQVKATLADQSGLDRLARVGELRLVLQMMLHLRSHPSNAAIHFRPQTHEHDCDGGNVAERAGHPPHTPRQAASDQHRKSEYRREIVAQYPRLPSTRPPLHRRRP